MSSPPKPVFPKPRGRSSDRAVPYRESTAPKSDPPREARVVHRPAPVDEAEALAPKARPKLTKDEVKALLQVSEASAGMEPGRSRSPFWNPRVLVVPTGPLVWMIRPFLPTSVVVALFVLWIVAMGWWVRRLVVDAREW